MLSSLVSTKAAVASAIGTGVLLAGGVGAAAAGVLPGAAQETANTWLEKVGISGPAGEAADENGDRRDRPEPADGNADLHGSGEADENAGLAPANDHGKQVSETARNSTAEGADKGAEIAEVASDGRVESGDRGDAGEDHGEPPVSAPNSGGTGTASDATEGQGQSTGAPDEGTAVADDSSDGASSDGSDNSPDGN